MKRVALFVTFVTAFGGVACKPSAPAPEGAAKPAVAGSAEAGHPAPDHKAAAADPWTAKAAAKDPMQHALFWSIEKDGKTSYALGTIHLGVDAEARLPAIVWTKLDAAPAFAMETDLSDPSLLEITRCSNCSLRRDLGDAYWKKLEGVLTPPVAQQIEAMKPMVAATMLSMKGLPPTPPMDGILLGRATNQHKKIVFLELASKEAAILEKWMNLKALKAMLDDAQNAEKHTQEMLDAYTAGDETKMVAFSDDERAEALKHGYTPGEYDQQMEDLLYARNASWIDPIDKLHASGGGFIAVGAMHLVGKKSVLELLAKKGYKVTRLTP